MAKLLDLPTEIRLQIFANVFGTQFFIVTSPHLNTDLRSSNTGDLKLDPFCDCLDPTNDLDVSDGHDDATRMSLLSVSKQVHSEAKDVLKAHVYTFKQRADLDSVLLTKVPGRAQRESLTTLIATICPRSFETHVWNLALRQLYLPRGTMTSPAPQFPTLKTLQLCVRGRTPSDARSEGNVSWRSVIWIFAFRFLALEQLENVSVDSTDYMHIRSAEVEDQTELTRLDEGTQNMYEKEVRTFLLREYLPGEEDEIELLGITYTRKLDELGMVEDVDA